MRAIQERGLGIYDPIEIGDPLLWIPTQELEALLDAELRGIVLAGLPLRTRSLVVKQHVCRALGYGVPPSFRRVRPRFTGQCFDVYAQKANNLQIWNEELSPFRRYVVLRISEQDVVERVRVVSGDTLAKLDTTGTLTQKYQARYEAPTTSCELACVGDTDTIASHLRVDAPSADLGHSTSQPTFQALLSARMLLERLTPLIGRVLPHVASDQERRRGEGLHRLVSTALGYRQFGDSGQFPDIRHQLLEVKLQTSPTIDLGLVRPDSTSPLDVVQLGGVAIRHRDVRYAVFGGVLQDDGIILMHITVTTGEAFFGRFRQFRGKSANRKLQIPLPRDFFDA